MTLYFDIKLFLNKSDTQLLLYGWLKGAALRKSEMESGFWNGLGSGREWSKFHFIYLNGDVVKWAGKNFPWVEA